MFAVGLVCGFCGDGQVNGLNGRGGLISTYGVEGACLDGGQTRRATTTRRKVVASKTGRDPHNSPTEAAGPPRPLDDGPLAQHHSLLKILPFSRYFENDLRKTVTL